MAGLKGQIREPRASARARRNSANLASNVSFVDAANQVVQLTAQGYLTLILAAAGGLENSSAELQIKLDTNPGLSLSASGLIVKVKANGGITLDANGLSVTAADETNRGGVLRQNFLDDVAALVDNSGGTTGNGTIGAVGVAVTDPADTPASADVLRDDLVANTIPSIETELGNLRDAVATLADYCSDLEAKINAMLAAQQTAEQMSTS